MMDAVGVMVTKLMLAAFDAAGVEDRAWRSQFKISSLRLSRLRAGRAALTEAELNTISHVTGEPWQNLLLSALGSADKLTADTRELLAGLHTLTSTAEAEAAAHQTLPKSKRRNVSRSHDAKKPLQRWLATIS